MVTLTTNRMVLTPICELDAADLKEVYDDEKVKKYLGGDSNKAPVKASRDWKDHGYGLFVLRVGGRVIGYCGFIRSMYDAGQYVEKVTAIVKNECEKGYAKEASIKLIEWFFASHLQHDRLLAFSTESNVASKGLLKVLGFKATGQSRMFQSPEREQEQCYELMRSTKRQRPCQMN
jgi:RimJ/RimL family protein N-acetyltransferase